MSEWLEVLREHSRWERITEPQEQRLVEWCDKHQVPERVREKVAYALVSKDEVYKYSRPDMAFRKWVGIEMERQPQAPQPGGWASWQAARSGG